MSSNRGNTQSQEASGTQPRQQHNRTLSIAGGTKLSKQERERMRRRFDRFASRSPPADKLSIEYVLFF